MFCHDVDLVTSLLQVYDKAKSSIANFKLSDRMQVKMDMKKLIYLLPLLLTLACSSDEVSDDLLCDPNEVMVWTGATLTFSKGDNANPTLEENQDRITDNVWLTRDNNGGGLYNAATEAAEDKNSSPAGTRWAVGSLSNVCDLEFGSFRSAVGQPKQAVGDSLVLYLVQDEIYLGLTITSWSQGNAGGGGFAYQRTTP
jgi:hypothetical protein